MNRDDAMSSTALRQPTRWPRLVVGVVIVGILGVIVAIVGFQEPGAAGNGKGPILDQLPEDHAAPLDLSIEEVEWLNGLQTSMNDDPRFGTIARDGSTITITWFGDPSEQLGALIDDAPANITVALQPADFLPGDLNDMVACSVGAGLVPGVQVSTAAMNNDGSGISIGIVEAPANRTLDDLGAEFAQALGRPDVPVTVHVAGVTTPAIG